jgi:dTDP-4-dehydrorhamnose reductase
MESIQKIQNMQSRPELWGGIECSINRVQNTYCDQCTKTGSPDHDLELFASLGIKALRYPLLWESHMPDKKTKPDWKSDLDRLEYLRQHNIKPILGLMHHGSGPQFTSLDDPQFATHLSSYAREAATAFPWVEDYTVINEPLTTARFSGLYGHWYPHKKEDSAFVKMLLNELKAIVLSMKEIQKINPSARLIQTEDLGKTYGSPELKYQCDFENERRWLTFDFLTGRVNKQHFLWDYLTWCGTEEDDLYFFLENTCPPAILGINHYITSERFLDINYEKYPKHIHGGNFKHYYADIEAIRVEHNNDHGCEILLKEAWKRYEIPLAITEVHLNGYREEQMKWFNDISTVACKLTAQQNIPIKAITAWALLGNSGWNQLLTSPEMKYECGCFDTRSGNARPTAVAKIISSYGKVESFSHPLLDVPGWWKRPTRFYINARVENHHSDKHVVIFGKGTLAMAFADAFNERCIPYVMFGRNDCDVRQKDQLEKMFQRFQPWAIINAAGFANAEKAETEIQKCYTDNVLLPDLLSEACKKKGIQFLTFSSDLVFDGLKKSSYTEKDLVNPLNNYGKTKVLSEKKVLSGNPDALVIRSSAFFAPFDNKNFLFHVIQSLKERKQFVAASDVNISPTYVPELVNTAIDLVIDEANGIWHVANKGTISWAELALEVCRRSHYQTSLITPVPYASMNKMALMPADSSLTSEHGQFLSTLERALDKYFNEPEIYELVTA